MKSSSIGSKPTRRAAMAVAAGLVTTAAANIPKNVIEADDAQIAAKIKTEGTQTRTALNAATVQGIQTLHDPIQTALNAQTAEFAVMEGSAFHDVAKFPGVDPTGATECGAALDAALHSLATFGSRAYGRGVFKTASQVTFTGDADFTDAEIRYEGPGGVVVQVGTLTGTLHKKQIKLPHVVNTTKNPNDWLGVEGIIGVQITNTYTADITLPHVRNCGIGVRMYGTNKKGVSYVNLFLGQLLDNKVNMDWDNGPNGWCNQNNIYGGRLSHSSNHGTKVPGVLHIRIRNTASAVNGNNFYGSSLESPNVVQYHLDAAGFDNSFIGCRWENTGEGARVIWRTGGYGNSILYGYYSHQIVETNEANTEQNNIYTRTHNRISGQSGSAGHSVYTIANRSSSYGSSIRILPANALGANESTDWAWDFSSIEIKGKRLADPFPRMILNSTDGRMYFSAGATAPVGYLGRVLDGTGFGGDHFYANPDNTWDIGANNLRPRKVFAGTAVVYGDSGPLPAAAASLRGESRVVRGGAGVADAIYLCIKNAANTYEWKQIA